MINLQDFKSIKLRHVADLFGNLSSWRKKDRDE